MGNEYYVPSVAKAQAKQWKEHTDHRKFIQSRAAARRFAKWFASLEDMSDLQRHFDLENYKAQRVDGDRHSSVYLGVRSYARRFARDYAEAEDMQELWDLYNQYKDHREEWAE